MKTLLVILAIALGTGNMGYTDTGPDPDGWTIDPIVILGSAGSVSAGTLLIVGGTVSGGASTAIGTGASSAAGGLSAFIASGLEFVGKIGPVIRPYDGEQAARFIQEF